MVGRSKSQCYLLSRDFVHTHTHTHTHTDCQNTRNSLLCLCRWGLIKQQTTKLFIGGNLIVIHLVTETRLRVRIRNWDWFVIGFRLFLFMRGTTGWWYRFLLVIRYTIRFRDFLIFSLITECEFRINNYRVNKTLSTSCGCFKSVTIIIIHIYSTFTLVTVARVLHSMTFIMVMNLF